MKSRFLLAAMVPALFLAGCDKTNWESSIFREKKFTKNDDMRSGFVITDAKQRMIMNVPNNRAGKLDPQAPNRVFCAEPSPDVSQALSEALKLAVEVKVEGRGQGGLGVDRSFSHSIAQLGERLAVIQLLRDKMYRACEAYANGAVQASGYTLMLARLDKTMATLLSAEMVAGAFGRSLAQLGGAAGTGGVDPAEMEKAQAAVTSAAAELKKASEETDAAKRKEKAEKASKNLEEANQKLFALELQSARTSAAGNALMASLGQINGGSSSKDSSGTIPASIVSLHRNYLDDHGLEPLIDACVVAMDAVTPDDNTKSTALNLVRLNFGLKEISKETPSKKSERGQSQDGTQDDGTKAPKPGKPQGATNGANLDTRLYGNIVSTLATQGSPFAAFCALRILTETNNRHAFIRHFTTLKRDLRNTRITRTEKNDDKYRVEVTHPSPLQLDKAVAEAIIAQHEAKKLKKRCEALSFVLAKNRKTLDSVKAEAAEFDSKKCATVLN